MRSKVALACAVLLAGIAIWEIIATKRAPAGVPDDEAWRTAAEVVRAEYHQGDLIVFAPPWVDPVGRMHLGDLISIDDAGRIDEAKYARVWEVSIRGAHRDAQPAFEREIDGVLVRRYDQTPATVLADVRTLTAKAGAARMDLQEVGFEPHRCLVVNAPARITFALPAGKLVGYAGIADVFTRRSPRDPAQVAVEENGKTLASIVSGVDDGWVRFETPVAAGDVTFVVTSAASNRLVCFAAEVRQ